MDWDEAAAHWEANAEAWTTLARAGYDIYRDHLNTPWFFRMLPDVKGLRGLDIGCGEGHNTRLLAERCAGVTAIDVAETFLKHAREAEQAEPRGIDYQHASAGALPFADGSFDFATAFMSLMDIPAPEKALAEAARVLRAGGFLQFSITHPCFDTLHRRNCRDANGRTYAIEVGRYFDRSDGRIDEWLFSSAPEEMKRGLRPFRVPRFARTMSEWINSVVDAGLAIERVTEPTADAETVRLHPQLQDTQIAGYFLHVRARKPRP